MKALPAFAKRRDLKVTLPISMSGETERYKKKAFFFVLDLTEGTNDNIVRGAG